MYAQVTNNIQDAVRVIREGRVVAFPTGTSYGLAVDTQQGFALQRLRNLKKRPEEKSFTVFMKESLWQEYLELAPGEKEALAKYAGKALTLLVKPKMLLEHLAQEGLVGLRVIDHPLMQELADAVSVPLTATSANVAGQEPCYATDCILKSFPGRIDETTYDLSLGCILDGGALSKSEPSTIAKLVDGKIEVIRQGALSL